MKTGKWTSWPSRRTAARMAAAVVMAMVTYYTIPRVVLAEAKARAKAAGYEMNAEHAELRLWEVVLHGVKATSARIELTADTVTVKYDSRLRNVGMTARKADATIKESKGSEYGGRRTEMRLVDSKVHIQRGKFRADAEVRTARVDVTGRIWADTDVKAESEGCSVKAIGVEVDGVSPEEHMDLKIKSVDIVLTGTGIAPGEEGKDENVRKDRHVGLTADRVTITRGEERVSADKVKAGLDILKQGQDLHLEAQRVTVAGNNAEVVTANVHRKNVDPSRTDVSFSVESLETENRKMSGTEFSIKKIEAKATIFRNGEYFTIPMADVRVGDARVNVYAATWKGGACVRAEMPEVGCQELLQSLPRELVPRLRPKGGETKMSGKISWKVDVEVDMPARKKPDVSIWLQNKCVVESVPEEIDVRKLSKPFRYDEYRADGKKTSEMVGPGTKDWTPISAVSPMMPAAVMAMEDPSFMSHRGILIQAIENSMEQNIAAGKFVRGGSTISMQLAKNLWLAREKTISRKIQEAVLTTYLEQNMTKTRMIELYLNVVEFGPNLYGIGPASRRYFAKDPGSLTLSQSLFLASLLPSPKSSGFEEGKKIPQGRLEFLRRIMKTMLDRGTISSTQYEQGLAETPVFGDPSAIGETGENIMGSGGIDPSEWR